MLTITVWVLEVCTYRDKKVEEKKCILYTYIFHENNRGNLPQVTLRLSVWHKFF